MNPGIANRKDAVMGKVASPAGLSALLLSAAEAEWAAAVISRSLRATRAVSANAPNGPAERHALKRRLLCLGDCLFAIGAGLMPAAQRYRNRAPFGITTSELTIMAEAADAPLAVGDSAERAALREALLRKCAGAVPAGEPGDAIEGREAACFLVGTSDLRALLSVIALHHGPPFTRAVKPAMNDSMELALDRLELRARAFLALQIETAMGQAGGATGESAIPFAATPRELVASLGVLRASLSEFEGRESEVSHYTRSTYAHWQGAVAALEHARFVPVTVD